MTCARADDGSSAATRSLPPQKALAVGDWQGWVPDVSGINGRQLAQVIHSPVGARDDAGVAARAAETCWIGRLIEVRGVTTIHEIHSVPAWQWVVMMPTSLR